MGLRYSTITGVARDDLPDGGAWLYAETVRQIHALNPGTGVELLIPDFNALDDQLAEVFATRPEVLAHNLETVPRIFKRIRPAFRYDRSLSVLTKARAAGLVTKSNLILGMGETPDEVTAALADLHEAGCEIITITQYLRPTPRHHPVERWVKPEEFVEHAQRRRGDGFRRRDGGPAGPLVLPRRPALRPDEAASRRAAARGPGAPGRRRCALPRRPPPCSPARAILTGMAGKPAKADKEAQKAAKREKRAASKMRYKQLWQAFQQQRRDDKLLLPLMIGSIVVAAALAFGIGLIFGMQWVVLPLGIAIGAAGRCVDLRTARAELRLRQGRRPAGRRGVGAGQHARRVAGHPGHRGHHPPRRRPPRDRPPGRDPRGRGRAAPGEDPARAGEEAHLAGRGQHPDLRLHRGQRRGPDPAARPAEDAHQAPAQHLRPTRWTTSRSASPLWARAARRCRRARCPRAPRCAASSARSRRALASRLTRVRTTTVRAARSCQPRRSASRTSGGTTTAINAVRSSGPRPRRPSARPSSGTTRSPSAIIPALAPNSGHRHSRQQEPDAEDEPAEPRVDAGSGAGEDRGDAVADEPVDRQGGQPPPEPGHGPDAGGGKPQPLPRIGAISTSVRPYSRPGHPGLQPSGHSLQSRLRSHH